MRSPPSYPGLSTSALRLCPFRGILSWLAVFLCLFLVLFLSFFYSPNGLSPGKCGRTRSLQTISSGVLWRGKTAKKKSRASRKKRRKESKGKPGNERWPRLSRLPNCGSVFDSKGKQGRPRTRKNLRPGCPGINGHQIQFLRGIHGGCGEKRSPGFVSFGVWFELELRCLGRQGKLWW